MGKKALAVRRTDVAKILQHHFDYNALLKEVFDPKAGLGVELYPAVLTKYLFHLDSYLLDRDTCETDPEYLQLLPYITFVTTDVNSPKILMYERGKAGDENRLHQKCSIGIGGHVDDAVDDTTTLLDVLMDNALREIKEEIGISSEYIQKEFTYKDSTNPFREYIYDNTKMIYANDDVGSVHLGLSIVIGIPESLLSKMVAENEVINNLQLVPAITEAFNEVDLEPWSDAVIWNLLESLKEIKETSVDLTEKG